MVTKQELRQAQVKKQGEALQEKLEKATVAICGLGGLGSHVAVLLARAGVGKLILIDYDRVELTNLHRQQYKVSQVGKYKAEALEENLKEIAPFVELEVHNEKVEKDIMNRLLQKADIVCEAFDNAETKAMLVNHVLENMPEKYMVAASGMAGSGDANEITTKKITSHFYLCGDGVSDVEKETVLLPTRVALCATHEAHKILQIIEGVKYEG